MGWCRLKVAGVEHCNLCGLSHLGHKGICPHLNSEAQLNILLSQLKESTESAELVDAATKHLKQVRAELVRKKMATSHQREMEIDRVNRAVSGLNGTASRADNPPMQHTTDWSRMILPGSSAQV